MFAVRATDAVTYHGEGPIWDPTGVLRFVDMLAGDVVSFDPRTDAVSRVHVGDVAACVVPRRDGGLAVAVERGFALFDTDGSPGAPLPEVWSDPTVRMNDGGCDPAGRFLCGTMAYDAAQGRGSLFRLDPDGSIHTLLTGATISNGLAWSADGATLFYVDSPTQRIDAFDYDIGDGTLSERRTVVEIPVEVGTPDGMTIDAEGGLWVALWGGRAVHRYLADGALDAVIEVDAPQPSSCAFGGDALDELFITTSAENLPDGEIGASGSLFRARPGVSGMPTLAFAG